MAARKAAFFGFFPDVGEIFRELFRAVEILSYRFVRVEEFFEAVVVQKDGIELLQTAPLRAADGEFPRIKAGQRRIQFQGDGRAVFAGDEGIDDIPLRKPLAHKRGIGVAGIGGERLKPCRFGGDGNKAHHAVAAVDVEKAGDGPEFVRGVIFAVAREVVVEAVMAVDPSPQHFRAEIVGIRSVAVDDLPHHPPPYKGGREELEFAVAAVFQEHEGRFGLLVDADELFAVLHRIGAAHFERRHFARAHAVGGDRNVRFPRGRNDDGVDILFFERFPVVGILSGRAAARLFDERRRFFHPVFIDVGDGDDLRLFHLVHHGCERLAAASEPDEGNFYFLHMIPPLVS